MRKISEREAKKEIERTLKIEADAILRARKSVGPEYFKALSLLINCKGKVIFMGVGKSGLIAQKIAATFSSTGTPAMFLDPTEAKHGGIGFIQKQDLIICLGKSGESEELNELFPALKSIGVSIIAITANASSTLAKNSKAAIITPIQEEACPLNLAPTASTTAALAVGDALAVALMKARKFGPKNFAQNHPSGRIGKRLHGLVRDVMRSGEMNPVVDAEWPLRHALVEITRLQAGAASVKDRHGRFVGLITDYDIRVALEKKKNILDLPVKKIMNPKPTFITPESSIFKAIAVMENRRNPFNVLPVVEGGRPVGLIQVHDLKARGL